MRKYFAIFAIFSLLAFPAGEAFAATKKKKANAPKVNVISPDTAGYYVSIKKKQIFCLGDTKPGTTKALKDGRVGYSSLQDQIKAAQKKRDNRKVAGLRLLLKKSKPLCTLRPETSLDKYKGPFGYVQAARLLRVTGFGAPPSEVNRMVAMGLDAAVNDIVDRNAQEPIIEQQMKELTCDTYFATDPEKRPCDPLDENDIEFSGMRTAYYHWALNTANQFQAKFVLYLNDHVAASSRVLSYCERHAALTYESMLRSFAQTGDLNAFLHAMVQNPLVAQWLNLYRSSALYPNEDFGREFLELFTIGKVDLDGNPRYGDAEIIASSRAFTGLRLVNFQSGKYTSCYLSVTPDLHDSNPKILWQGTPYQTVVYNADDMVEAVKRHPGLAEYWALNIWREYINDKPSKRAISEAADVLRKDGYNIKALMKTLLKSKAEFAEDSKSSIYKLPIEYALDILRTTGMPKPHPRWFLWNLDDLAQEMWNPPTVFGWYTYADNYMNSRYVLGRRNLAMNLIDSSEDDLTQAGFDFFNQVLSDAPSAETLIDRFSMQLGVRLNDAQKAALLEFMNYDIDWQGNTVRDVYDSVRGSDNAVWKAIGLWLLLIEQVDFQAK